MSVQRQTGQWKDVEDMCKGREHNATHRDLLPSWATYAPARGRAHEYSGVWAVGVLPLPKPGLGNFQRYVIPGRVVPFLRCRQKRGKKS
jgi:hypothetical protein